MKTQIIVGTNEEPEDEVTVKDYGSGRQIIADGEAGTSFVNRKPTKVQKVKMNKKLKKEFMRKPDKFKITNGKLVKKGKKK